MLKNDSWLKLREDLKTKMKGYEYLFEDALTLIGCGAKTLHRYVDAEYITPIKISDNWLFTEDMINKCRFLVKSRIDRRLNNQDASALYDYMKKNGLIVNYDDIEW